MVGRAAVFVLCVLLGFMSVVRGAAAQSSQTVHVTLVFPPGMARYESAVNARGTLRINDRAKLFDAAG